MKGPAEIIVSLLTLAASRPLFQPILLMMWAGTIGPNWLRQSANGVEYVAVTVYLSGEYVISLICR